jgi:hypothetical protein
VVLTAYAPPDWSLSCILRGEGSFQFDAEADGSAFRFNLPPATTSAWPPGRYWYSARVTNGTDVIEIEAGEVTITPDLAAAAAGFDGRDHIRRVLDAIEAVIEKRATIDQQRYTINNRELWRTPIPELLVLRDRYRAELRRQAAKNRGDLFGQAVRVRFR